MNILLLANKFPFPPNDGGSIATYRMIEGLAGAGNRVDVLAMNTSRHRTDSKMVAHQIPGLNTLSFENVDTTIRWGALMHNLLFSEQPYNAVRFVSADFDAALESILTGTEYDIIQLEGLYLSHYADTIRRHSKALISYRAHNIEHHIWNGLRVREKNSLKRWYIGNLSRRLSRFEMDFINKYDLLVPITANDEMAFAEMGNVKDSHTAPFGVPGIQAGKYHYEGEHCRNIQYLGSLDWMPNIDGLDWFVENVWNVLRKKNPGMSFSVAGRNVSGDLAGKLKSNAVDFRGEVESAAGYLLEDGVMVVPLFSGSGIRVRIIEAMIMGKPIISTPMAVSGIPAADGEHLLLANDAESFTGHLFRLANEPDYARYLGQNARELALKFYINEDIAEKLTAFYKNSLG